MYFTIAVRRTVQPPIGAHTAKGDFPGAVNIIAGCYSVVVVNNNGGVNRCRAAYIVNAAAVFGISSACMIVHDCAGAQFEGFGCILNFYSACIVVDDSKIGSFGNFEMPVSFINMESRLYLFVVIGICSLKASLRVFFNEDM